MPRLHAFLILSRPSSSDTPAWALSELSVVFLLLTVGRVSDPTPVVSPVCSRMNDANLCSNRARIGVFGALPEGCGRGLLLFRFRRGRLSELSTSSLSTSSDSSTSASMASDGSTGNEGSLRSLDGESAECGVPKPPAVVLLADRMCPLEELDANALNLPKKLPCRSLGWAPSSLSSVSHVAVLARCVGSSLSVSPRANCTLLRFGGVAVPDCSGLKVLSPLGAPFANSVVVGAGPWLPG